MNPLQQLFIVFIFIPISGFGHFAVNTQVAPDSISISLTIKNRADLPLTISTPINGCFFIGQWHKIKTDKDGHVYISLPLDSSGFCQIWLNYLPWIVGKTKCVQIYAEPGGEYQISFDHGNEFHSVQFAGNHKRENELLNSFNRYTVDFWGQSEYLKTLMLKKNGTTLLKFINQLKANDLKTIDTFNKNYRLKNIFLKVLKEDVKYYYARLFYTAWFVNEQKLKKNPNTMERAQWKEALNRSCEKAEIDNATALGSLWYNEYKQIIWWFYYEEVFGSVTNIPTDQPMFTYYAISKLFSRKVREQHLAYRIKSDAAKNKFSKKTQEWYKTFCKDYPSSPFLVPLHKEFKDVLDFTNSKDSSDIKIISTFNDLNELIQRFPNQMLFVDVWASWCGPCKIEFKLDNTELHEFCSRNNIRLVYITIDDSSKTSTCSEIIRFYSLTGDHFIANKSLYTSLKKELNYDKSFPIPRYFIIDRAGKLVEKNALRPSSKEELIKQLSLYLN